MRPNQPRWKGYPIHAKCGPACRALQSQARGCHKGAPSKEGLKRLNNLKEMKRKDFSTYAKMIKLMINEGDSSRNPESRQLANKMLVDYDKFSVMKLAKFQSAIGRSGNKQLKDLAGGFFAKANMSRTKAAGHNVEAASDNEDDDEEDGGEDEEQGGRGRGRTRGRIRGRRSSCGDFCEEKAKDIFEASTVLFNFPRVCLSSLSLPPAKNPKPVRNQWGAREWVGACMWW